MDASALSSPFASSLLTGGLGAAAVAAGRVAQKGAGLESAAAEAEANERGATRVSHACVFLTLFVHGYRCEGAAVQRSLQGPQHASASAIRALFKSASACAVLTAGFCCVFLFFFPPFDMNRPFDERG